MGASVDGQWIIEEKTKQDKEEESVIGEDPGNIYMYEGQDYSKCSESDNKKFEELINGWIAVCKESITNIALFLFRAHEVD